MSGSRDRGDGPGPGGGPGGRRTADRLAFADLALVQPARGYRFSVDAVLLARFAAPFARGAVLDLGTGCGVVLLLLARLGTGIRRGTGVEIQPPLWECAVANIAANGLGARFDAVLGDFREPLPGVPPGAYDLVVSNPPFRPARTGRRSPDRQREAARHEVTGTMADLFRAAGRHVAPKGRFAALALPERLPELLRRAEENGIRAERLRFVHPFPGRPARLVLFLGSRRAGGGPVVLPPLVVHEAPGIPSPEVEGIVRGLRTT